MANKWGKDAGFWVGNQTSILVDLKSYVNSVTLNGNVDLLDQTGLGNEAMSFLEGLEGGTFDVNFWINSTTETAFGPSVAQRTSKISKAQWYNGVKYYVASVHIGNVQQSGTPPALLAGSATLTFEGALSRTSASAA